jgi:hypothetical protein
VQAVPDPPRPAQVDQVRAQRDRADLDQRGQRSGDAKAQAAGWLIGAPDGDRANRRRGQTDDRTDRDGPAPSDGRCYGAG